MALETLKNVDNMIKNSLLALLLFVACSSYGQIGRLRGENYTGTKALWNECCITYRLEIKVANVNKGRIQTVYKDISFINPDPQKNYSETYFLLWETTKNLILPFYQLYILDGEKWRLYSEIPKT